MSLNKADLKKFVRRSIAQGLSRLPQGLFTDRNFFSLYESRGVHMIPAHYYYPVPILSELDESVWSSKSAMTGIEMNLAAQSRLLESFSKQGYFGEYSALNGDPFSPPSLYSRNVGYGGVDGAILYSMIRSRKPQRIIEIGSGSSTLLSLIATRKNSAEGTGPCHITAIEPYPSEYLREAIAGTGEVLQQRVETVSFDLFASLKQNDVLFIDSSHTVKIGGDVVFEINEILPRLRKGVIIHIHDIAFPLNYPRKMVVENHMFWAEQYLLQAFLAFNPKFQVLWCFSYVQSEQPKILREHFPNFPLASDGMGAFWMEVVA